MSCKEEIRQYTQDIVDRFNNTLLIKYVHLQQAKESDKGSCSKPPNILEDYVLWDYIIYSILNWKKKVRSGNPYQVRVSSIDKVFRQNEISRLSCAVILNMSVTFQRHLNLLQVRVITFVLLFLLYPCIVFYCINGVVTAVLMHCGIFRSIVLPRIQVLLGREFAYYILVRGLFFQA